MKVEKQVRETKSVLACDRCGSIKAVKHYRFILEGVVNPPLAEGDLCETCRDRAKASFVRHTRPRKAVADAVVA